MLNLIYYFWIDAADTKLYQIHTLFFRVVVTLFIDFNPSHFIHV